MTREIKFRAWHPDTKEMMPVDCIDWDETGYLTEVNAGYCWGEKFNPEKFQRLVLMQYTGLKDKNGKEIYEGDVVKGEKRGHVYEVKYDPYYGGFDPFVRCDYGATSYYDYPLEVIGNIYSNPELLQ